MKFTLYHTDGDTAERISTDDIDQLLEYLCDVKGLVFDLPHEPKLNQKLTKLRDKTNIIDGSPCRRCGSTKRYKVSKSCVECSKSYGKVPFDKTLTYEGKPCIKCGATTRNVSTNKCVACVSGGDNHNE